jgi:hypothetical protein
MSEAVVCPVCGFTCKNQLVAYSSVCGGTNFLDIDVGDKTVPICLDCCKKIALAYVEEI